MTKTQRPEQRSDEHMSEYYKLELSQVVDRVNSLEGTRLQLGIFFGTANLTILGVAMYVQKAGVLFIAAAIMIVFILIDIRVRALHVAYFYRGLQLQRKFAKDDEETFLRIIPGDVGIDARRIARLESLQDRRNLLFSFSLPFQSIFFRLSLLVIVGEIIVGVLLWLRFNWSLT
jgi:hypothetical protein